MRLVSAGSQRHPVPGSQAAGDVIQDPDSVLHEPEGRGVPSELVAVRDATAPHDRAQRQYDQAHVVTAADAQPHTQGDGRVAYVSRAADRRGRVHGDTDQARGRTGQRAGQTIA